MPDSSKEQEDTNLDNKSTFFYGETPEQVVIDFIDNLTEGQNYCRQNSEHWAEIKTYSLSREVMIFNLGLLGFLATARNYLVLGYLYAALILSALSVILAFYYIWVVLNENINSLNKRDKIMSRTIKNLVIDKQIFGDVVNKYNTDISEVMEKMRRKEKIYNHLQDNYIILFIGAILSSILGLILFRI